MLPTRTKNEGEKPTDALANFTRGELIELAKLKGTKAEQLIRKYIDAQELNLAKRVFTLKFPAEAKDGKALFWLQDVQSQGVGMKKVANLFTLADRLFKERYKDKP